MAESCTRKERFLFSELPTWKQSALSDAIVSRVFILYRSENACSFVLVIYCQHSDLEVLCTDITSDIGPIQ